MRFKGKKIPFWWLAAAFAVGALVGCVLMAGIITKTGKWQTAAPNDGGPEAVSDSAKIEGTEGYGGESTQNQRTDLPKDAQEGRQGEGADTPSGDEKISTPGIDNNIPQWAADQVYTGGDIVWYQGKYYKAKWWTQNEIPGQADVWEDTKEVPVSASGREGGGMESEVKLPAVSDPREGGEFRVIAYYPSWTMGDFYEGTSVSEKVQFDKLTHLVYAFAIPTPQGDLLSLDNAQAARELIQTAHEYGVKVMLAVGGWSYHDTPLESTFVSATENEQKRETFAQAIVDLCKEYGFDGIDLDWEHPRVDGSSGKQYEALVLLLADKLHQEGLLLSSAVISGATADGTIYYDAAAHTDKVLAAVDWINVMAYDGGDGERHSTYEFAVASADYWQDTRGVPAEKINLGVPFYSRPGWASYEEILEQDPQAWDSDTTRYQGMQVWYNGIDTIRAKTRYALENLGGIMIWEITQDTSDREKSLLTAVWKELQGLP